jgi:hypothetical protein
VGVELVAIEEEVMGMMGVVVEEVLDMDLVSIGEMERRSYMMVRCIGVEGMRLVLEREGMRIELNCIVEFEVLS